MSAPKLGDPLSAHELRTLALVAEGLLNASVAREMNLAEDTVKTHLRRAFVKLGAKDRANAVWLACQAGLLGVAPKPVPAAVERVPDGVLAELLGLAESVALGRPVALLRGQAVRALVASGRRVPVRRAS